jgi:hypothetical protein
LALAPSPGDNYIRQMLDGAPTQAFDPLFIKAIETPQVLTPFQRLGGRILAARWAHRPFRRAV